MGLGVLCGVSVYYYPLFMLTMFLAPAIWATLAFRTHPVLLAGAGGLVFLFGYLAGFDGISCLSILGMVLPAGFFLWLTQKERMGNFQSVIYVSLLLTFGAFLLFCLPDLLASGDPYASLRSYFVEMSSLFEGTVLYESTQLLTGRVDELMVPCFFVFAGVYALVNVLLLHAFNKGKKDMPLCPLGKYGTWAAPYGYVMVLGGASLLSALLNAAMDTPMASALSMLLYEMWALPLYLTGANCLFTLLKRRLPESRRFELIYGLLLGTGLLFLTQIANMALLLLGLVEVIRRRRAGKERR